MTQTALQSFLTIGAIALVTFFTRALPFLLFPANRKTPGFVLYLGKVLPFAIIGMLVVYCLKNVTPGASPYGLPEAVSLLFLVLIHKWKHNTLLSIGTGTVLYMALLQFLMR